MEKTREQEIQYLGQMLACTKIEDKRRFASIVGKLLAIGLIE